MNSYLPFLIPMFFTTSCGFFDNFDKDDNKQETPQNPSTPVTPNIPNGPPNPFIEDDKTPNEDLLSKIFGSASFCETHHTVVIDDRGCVADSGDIVSEYALTLECTANTIETGLGTLSFSSQIRRGEKIAITGEYRIRDRNSFTMTFDSNDVYNCNTLGAISVYTIQCRRSHTGSIKNLCSRMNFMNL